MAKYPKVVQADKRGQIVIPQSIREELGIQEGAAFWVYHSEEGILLKKIEEAPQPRSVKKTIKGVKGQ